MGTWDKIWKARKHIMEGVTNLVFRNKFIEDVAKERLAICNTCEHKGDDCEIPGTGPCSGACGCILKVKVRSLSSECGLVYLDKEPLWEALLTEQDEELHLGI